jgi:hypothetical protein
MAQALPVQREDASAQALVVRPSELVHEDEKRRQPLFVNRGLEQPVRLVERQVAELSSDGALRGHGDADEPVAFTIIAGPALEEPRDVPRTDGIGLSPQGAPNGRRGWPGRC